MKVPAAKDPIWQDLLTGRSKCNFEYLAVRLLQGSLTCAIDRDSSQENLQSCCARFREFFLCNADHPLIQEDLRKIATEKTTWDP